MKVTTIGAALVDIYFESEAFVPQGEGAERVICQPYGRKVEIADHEITTGGAGTNVAVGLARRGHDVSIVAEVGNDVLALMIKNELVSEKVNTLYLVQETAEKTGCSVIFRGGDGGRTIMTSRSAAAMLDDYDIPLDYLKTQDWIHLSSVGGNLNALSEIWQVFGGSEEVGLSWNPGTAELRHLAKNALIMPEITKGVFLVNKEEWEMVKNVQQEIGRAFPYVVVTAGKELGQLYQNGELKQEFAPKSQENAYEETGAGDAFASGFVSTLLYERSVEEALIAGLNNADAVIKFVGAKKGLLSF